MFLLRQDFSSSSMLLLPHAFHRHFFCQEMVLCDCTSVCSQQDAAWVHGDLVLQELGWRQWVGLRTDKEGSWPPTVVTQAAATGLFTGSRCHLCTHPHRDTSTPPPIGARVPFSLRSYPTSNAPPDDWQVWSVAKLPAEASLPSLCILISVITFQTITIFQRQINPIPTSHLYTLTALFIFSRSKSHSPAIIRRIRFSRRPDAMLHKNVVIQKSS